MDTTRYYYSRDGTATEGPVTNAELGQLYRAGVLGPGSFVCPEGGSQWTSFNPAPFQVAVPPRPPTPPRPAYVPPPQATSYRFESESGSVAAKIVDGIAAVFAIGCAIFTATITHPAPGTRDSIAFHMGAFAGALFAFCIIPCLVCLFFKGLTRSLVRGIGIIVLGCLSVAGNLMRLQQLAFIDAAKTMSAQVQADAKKQIAEKGYYEGNPDQAQQNIDKLRAMATGNSEAARGERDLADVMKNMFAKVKAAQTAEAACNFKVGDIASQDDLTQRRQLIQKLRVAQGDVLADLQSFDATCRDVMGKDNLSSATMDALINGAKKGGHIETLVQLWQTQVKLSDDYLARLDFLDKCYGSWTTKDGKVIFTDNDSLAQFNTYVASLQADAKQVKELQAQMVQ